MKYNQIYVIQRDAANLLQIRNWKAAEQEIRRSGGRRLGRPWPENRPKHHRRRYNQIHLQ
jgi:hypothetical protein